MCEMLERIKKFAFKAYIWVKLKFMTLEEIYQDVAKRRKTCFQNIIDELPNGRGAWFNTLINYDENNNILEFKIGEMRFLISIEIREDENQGFVLVVKPFTRKLDLSYYPESSRYTSAQIGDLEITINRFRESTPSKPFTGKTGAMGVIGEISLFDSNHLGAKIIEQLSKYVEKNTKPV